MAIIYAYPIAVPQSTDLILGSVMEGGKLVTRNFRVSDVSSAGSGTVTSLTTTGTSGVSTLTGGTLNIPNYAESIDNTSKVIYVTESDLAAGATLEDRIATYVNTLNYNKEDIFADVWVEYSDASGAVTAVNLGYLYNWYTADDSRNIANTGWGVPTIDNQKTLSDFLGGNTVAGGKMKETGLTYWLPLNTGATNTSGFNGRGGGTRIAETGVFDRTKDFMQYWAQGFNTSGGYVSVLTHAFATYTAYSGTTWFSYPKATGGAIRLIKDTTSLTDGQTGTYTGNDGKVYRTICIGTQEWLADNLVETKYRNLDLIPEVTSNTTWAALTTGARCSYDNNEANAI